MKTINKFMLGMAIFGTMAMATSCSDDDKESVAPAPVEDPTFEILTELPDPPTYSFASAGNKAQTLAFNTNQNWKIDLVDNQEGADYGWLTLFDRQGTGSENTQRVWISAAKNTGYDARRAEFTLTVGDGEDATVKTFLVYQAQLDAILATDPKAFMNLSNAEQVLPLDFQYNVNEYEITVSDKNWMEVTDEAPNQTRALVSATKYVKFSANTKFDIRTGTITIKDKNNSSTSVTVPVTQFGLAKPVIVIDNAADYSVLPSAASATELQLSTENVTSVCDQLTVDIPAAARSWLSFVVNADSTGYILKAKENTGGERTATVSVCAKADHNVKTTLAVKQASADGVTVTITNKDAFDTNVDKMGGICYVKYQTDEENWDCAVEDLNGNAVDWVKVVNKKMPGQILFSYEANPTLKIRSAILKVYPVGNEDKADMVTLVQAAGTQVILNGTLQNTLDQLVADGIYKSVQEITSLELKGELSRADYDLLKTMLKGNGYKLNTLDLTEVTTEKIVNNQFNGCTQLKKIIFPKALRVMEERICQGCTSLTSVKFNEGPTYICNHAFNGCTALSEVWIPSTMQYLYGSSFEKCANLTKIHLQCLPLQIYEVARSPSQPTTASSVFMNQDVAPKNSTLYVPSGYVQYYKNPDPQHVVNMHLADYLKGLTSDSKEWTSNTPAFDWKPGTNALKSSFSWTNVSTTIIEENSWDK